MKAGIMCENEPVEMIESTEEVVVNTQTKIIRFNKTWVIENFKHNTRFGSPIFSIDRCEKFKWRLQLRKDVNGLSHPSLVLFPCKISAAITLKHTYALLIAECWAKTTLRTSGIDEIDPSRAARRSEFGVKAGFNIDKIYSDDDLLPYKKLTLFCEVELWINKISDFPAVDLPIIKVPTCDLHDKLSLLLETQEFSDFAFNVGGDKFFVHKNVLSISSPVFKAMFDHKMAEKQENEATVTDIEPEVFKEMLVFIYTCQVPNLQNMADKLLVAADKYQLDRLKLMSEEMLTTKMIVDNAVDILMLADCHNAQQLKQYALHFVALNTSDVMQTTSYKEKLKLNACLISEVLEAVVSNRLPQ